MHVMSYGHTQGIEHVSLRPTGADPGRILGAEDGREEALLLQGVLHWGHVRLLSA